MASFHLFPDLPLDVRLEIWEQVATHHRVVAFLPPKASSNLIHGYRVPTPAPAIFHVCRESRIVGVKKYEKAFIDGHRSVWINFDVDTVQIDWNKISMAFPERTKIKHIQAVHRPSMNDDFMGYLNASRSIALFSQLKTFDFLAECIYDLGGFITGINFGRCCPKKNVRVIQAKTGEYVTHRTEMAFVQWWNRKSMDKYRLAGERVLSNMTRNSPSEYLSPWVNPIVR